MSTAVFLAAQRNALRNLAICPPAVPAVDGVQIVIDRIDIGANALRHNVETEFPVFYDDLGERAGTKNPCFGYQTQIAQDVTLHLTTMAEILSHPNQPAPLLPITVTLVFDLVLFALDDDCYLKISMALPELGPSPLSPSFSPLSHLPKSVQDQIAQYLQQNVAPFLPLSTVPLGLGKLAGGAKFMNAGVSVDAQMQRIAFRAEIGGQNQNADVPWSNFFKGFFVDRLQGSDWSLFVQAAMMTEKLKILVYQQIPKDDSLEAYPGCTYANAGGRAVLTIDALLIYHLYRNRDLNIDISAEADPKVSIQLGVDPVNWLNVDFDFAHLLDSNDPLVELAKALLKLLGVPLESFVMTMASSAAMTALAGTPLDYCKQLSPSHIQCYKFVALPSPPGAVQIALTKVLALDDGIALAGTMSVRELTSAIVQTSVREFAVSAPSLSCGAASMALIAAFRNNPTAFPTLHARAWIENQGTAPLRLCNPPLVLKGANGPFPQAGIRTDSPQAPIQLSVDFAAPAPDYYAAPYPLDLLIKTSGGTRLVRFNSPPVVMPQDNERMAAELLVKLGNCEQLVDEWFRLHRGYNPRWSPRPPEPGVAVQHLWEVAVSGLPAAQTVSLVHSGNRLMEAIATGGPVRLSAMVSPGGERDLTILRVGAPGAVMDSLTQDGPPPPPPADTKGRGIAVRQTVLLHLGSIPLSAQCQKVVTSDLLPGPSILAVLDNGIVAYDFTRPELPMLAGSWLVDGVRGALPWRGALVVFGNEGVETIAPAGRRGISAHCESSNRDRGHRDIGHCETGAVLDAAADRQSLYLLTEEALHVYSSHMCRIASVPFEGGRSLALFGNVLIVGGDRGLALFEIGDPRRLQPASYLQQTHVRTVRPAPLGETGSFVAVCEDGTAHLFRLHRGRPEQIGHYAAAPWFLDTVRLGEMVVKIGANRTSLDIYRPGETSVF